MEAYAAENSLDFSLIHDPALARRLREVQIAAIERKLPTMEAPSGAHLHLGELYSEIEEPEPAIDHYKEATRLDPDTTWLSPIWSATSWMRPCTTSRRRCA
ncbi:MAG: hypothetical protein HZB87_00090 [Desulfatitalea sp.]|nr:hypothetical protein [Desulfatitalea sp.]